MHQPEMSGRAFLNLFQLAFIVLNFHHVIELWGISCLAYYCLASILVCIVSLLWQGCTVVRDHYYSHL